MHTTLYFAYGSNINAEQMARRCMNPMFLGITTLPDHRYLINKRGVATVLPQPGHTVTGVLWVLTSEDEAAMDIYEGVPVHYKRTFLDVVWGDGQPQKALVYLALETRSGQPRPGYQDTIVQKARELGFVPSYLTELEQWL